MEGKRRRKRREWRNYYRGGEKRGKELPFLATTQLSTTKALEMNIYLGKRNLPLYLHGHCWLHMSHEPHWSEVSVWGWRFWSIWWMPNTMPSWWCPPSALPPPSSPFRYFKSLVYTQALFFPVLPRALSWEWYYHISLLEPCWIFFHFSLFPCIKKKNKRLGAGEQLTAEGRRREQTCSTLRERKPCAC